MRNIFSFFLLLLFLVSSLMLKAQCPPIIINGVASPDVFCLGTSSQLTASAQLQGGGYIVYPISYVPVPGSGTSVALSDDQVSSFFPIGFNFLFFGNIYNQFNICSNGYISFDSNSPILSSGPIPNTFPPNNFIAASIQDLNPSVGGNINYFTTGSAPYRQLVVNFIGVPPYGVGNPVTMQFVLCETTNYIEIHITSQPNFTTSVEGIENALGTSALTVPGRNAASWNATNDSWRFAYGDTVLTYSWSPSTYLSDTAIYNPVATPSSSIQYIVTATDSNGCTGVDTIDLIVTNPFVTLTATQETLCVGENTQLNASALIASTLDYSIDSIPFAPLTGAGTSVTLGDDDVSISLPIGFLFSFYGRYYSEFNIGSNGFITFDSSAGPNNYQGCCAGQLLPNPSPPNNLIAGAWEDLNPTGGGTIKYFTTGTFPYEKLVVQFTNVPHAPARDSVTFEIILYETTNYIEIHTTSMLGNPHGYWYAHTQGIENADGLQAHAIPGRNSNNTWTAVNEAWRYTPVSPLTYTWLPADSLSDATIYNPVASPDSTVMYTVFVTDSSGCQGSASILITVLPPLPAPIITYSLGQLHSDYLSGNQWYFNGGIIPGAVLPDYTPPQTGIYNVTVTDSNGCSASSDTFFVTVGIDEIDMQNNFNVYPNPVTGALLTVTSAISGEFEFTLFDITSRQLIQDIFISKTVISTDVLSKGFYFYEIKNKYGVLKAGKIEIK